MLITSGGLKNSNDFLKLIDEELVDLLYGNNPMATQVQVNFQSPQAKDILGDGLMGKVLSGHLQNTPAAFKCLKLQGGLSSVTTDGR